MPAITRELDVLARCGNQFRGERLKDLSLTAFQAPYLLRVCAHPGMSQEELARAMHVNASNAARQLASLEEGGFITRETRAQDKRQLAIFPTRKARDALPVIRGVNAQWHAWLTAEMTAAEAVTLENLLEKMRRRAEAWDAGKDAEKGARQEPANDTAKHDGQDPVNHSARDAAKVSLEDAAQDIVTGAGNDPGRGVQP